MLEKTEDKKLYQSVPSFMKEEIELISGEMYSKSLGLRNIIKTIVMTLLILAYFSLPVMAIIYAKDSNTLLLNSELYTGISTFSANLTTITLGFSALSFLLICIGEMFDLDEVLGAYRQNVAVLIGINKIKRKKELKKLTKRLNDIYIINDEHVIRQWQYLDMKKSTIDYLIFNFNEFDSVNTNGSINIDQFNTIAKEKHEQDAILYEAQDIPKIKEDFVFKISKILMEQHILRTQKEKEEMIEKSYHKFKSVNDKTTVLEQSLNGAKDELEKMNN